MLTCGNGRQGKVFRGLSINIHKALGGVCGVCKNGPDGWHVLALVRLRTGRSGLGAAFSPRRVFVYN
jgi:hypothetical protein